MLTTCARFEQYRVQTFRVAAQEDGAQHLDGTFVRKMTWFRDIDLRS